MAPTRVASASAYNSPFAGVTNEFRNSTEFKDLSTLVRKAYPSWPEYLVETAVVAHITKPRAYRDALNGDKAPIPDVVVPDRTGLFDDAVKVYTGVDDPTLPVLVPVDEV